MNGKVWTQSEIDILSRMYPDHFAEEIGAVLNRKATSVYNQAIRLGLRSSKEKIRRSGSGSKQGRSSDLWAGSTGWICVSGMSRFW